MNNSTQKTDAMFKQIQESLYLYFQMITQSSYFVESNISLTLTEFHMLSRIEKLGITTITKLAQDTGLTKGGISTLVSKLEKKLFVKKEPDETHGSRVLISVTNRGKIVAEKMAEFHDKNNTPFIDYLQNLSPEEFSTVLVFTEKMHKWLLLFNKSKI